MNTNDPFKEQKLQQIRLLIYLIPVIGIVPALWTLYLGQGDRRQIQVSRLAIALTGSWLLAYILLWFGPGQNEELLNFRLMYLNGLLTSGYFVVCVGLMFRIWQGKLPRLPKIR
jgi:hypothetical protein